MMTVVANILDPVQDTLDPTVWDAVNEYNPVLKPQHKEWILSTILDTLKDHGYGDMDKWLEVYFTGSLTTFQYSKESDVDVSLFVNTDVFPEWSRAEMIGLMVSEIDGRPLPGTTHPMQCYVVAKGIRPDDLYKPGLRSGYDIQQDRWVVPPERDRGHDVAKEQVADYHYALEQADKMDRLLRYEPDKAVLFWHQIHHRRMTDQKMGKGDFAQSNIIYKFLANRGLFPQIAELSGEHIAGYFTNERAETYDPNDPFEVEMENERLERQRVQALPDMMYHVSPVGRRDAIRQHGLLPDAERINNESDHPPGVYLWDDPEVAMKYRGQGPNMFRDMDIHAVQVRRDQLQEDPWFKENYQDRATDFPGAYYSPNAIGPESVHKFYPSAWHKWTAKMNPLPTHLEDNWLTWEPGTEGKGFILDNGKVWHWPTENLRPMHMNRVAPVKSMGGRVRSETAFHIDPEGGVYQVGPGRKLDALDVARLYMADRRLNVINPPEGTEGFAHAPDVYEKLKQGKTAGLMPHPDQVEVARQRLNLQHPVRFMPTYQKGLRGGYAGISRDPQTGQDSHLIYFNPEQHPGAKNWAAWHELGHAWQHEQGQPFEPNHAWSDDVYYASPKEAEAEALAAQHADHQLWKTANVGQAEANDTIQPPSEEAWSIC